MLKYSVITINYNNINGLIKTIQSVVNQSYKYFEFIVIDGGSNDKSLEIIMRFESQIKYWVSENDNGVYHAMNKGLAKATGDYCIFLNSGDFFKDQFVLSRIPDLILGDEDLFYGLIAWEEKKQIWNPLENLRPFEIAFHSPIPHQGAFFRVDTLNQMGGYNENYRIISDWGVFVEFLLAEKKVKKIGLIISTCENQGISASSKSIILKERIKYLWRHSKITLVKGLVYQLKLKLKL